MTLTVILYTQKNTQFKSHEIAYLRKLYEEEVEHFNYVVVDRFHDVLFEVGEKMSKYRIIKLFLGELYSQGKGVLGLGLGLG